MPPPREATFLQLAAEALQDFTVLVLLAAGGLSLGLELLVHGGGSGGEPSWIEGASILAAGRRSDGCRSVRALPPSWSAVPCCRLLRSLRARTVCLLSCD